ncbi:uncharacterized protein [Watersipora subatra]|uniref:uncharacterized protein isoform X2 n=1 Tax=Watersipora subatra TaxID=2589382 RepID=UPI00355BA83B
MASREAFTQTDREVHDVYYYKIRAYNAERELLLLRRDQYIQQLQLHLKELEKETSNKLNLYSYDSEKVRQLQQEFQHCTITTEQLQHKAQEILNFNLDALNDGHELNDLPHVEDKDVDLNTFRLGPVTPTIPGGSRAPSLMPNLPRVGDGTEISYSPLVGQGGMSNFTAGAYNFPRTAEVGYGLYNSPSRTESSSGFTASTTNHQNAFNLAMASHPTATSQFTGLDMHGFRGEEILRMLSSDNSLPHHQHNGHATMPFYSSSAISSASSSKPDVIPKTSSPSTSFVPHQPILSISGAMGLDRLDLDYQHPSPGKPSSQKWSQIAVGSDSLMEGDWQAVGSRKGRPASNPSAAAKQLPMSINHQGMGAIPEVGANFEQMVIAVQDKYQLTRPEVIAVLQGVRNERHGDMNIPLTELMRDAERLLTKSKNILKPASLTVRARAVPDHEEPCENQLCPARLKLLKYRTELCLSFQTTGKCHMKPGSCVYAHGQAELRPLPKEELCDRYLEGKCNNRKCVYAHGACELKNRPMVNTVEYLKSKQKKSQPLPSSKPANSEDYSLTPADLDPRGEECAICMERMSKKSRKKLECGHDAFHYKCLKKWVAGEGDRSCPLCRNTTLLPEEYPHLGSH